MIMPTLPAAAAVTFLAPPLLLPDRMMIPVGCLASCLAVWRQIRISESQSVSFQTSVSLSSAFPFRERVFQNQQLTESESECRALVYQTVN